MILCRVAYILPRRSGSRDCSVAGYHRRCSGSARRRMSCPRLSSSRPPARPIGRAFKGSLQGHPSRRPDRADRSRPRWPRSPSSTRVTIDDLMLGCGLPGGEQGFNMGRVVAVLLGLDHVPGTTVTRYCSSSLQTTRMALHAIKAGEGDVFISAGVETVSRFANGSSDSLPGHDEPAVPCRAAAQRRADRGRGAAELARPARTGRAARRLHGDGPDRGERRAVQGRLARRTGRVRRARRRTSPRRRSPNGFWAREITPVTLPDGTVVDTDDGPGAGVTLEALAELKPVFRPDGTRHRRQLLPAQRRRRRGHRHERHEGPRARHHPAGPDRLDRRHRPVARRSWASARSRPPGRPWPGRA